MGVRVGAVWRCRVRGQDDFGHVGVAAEAFGPGIPLGVERDAGQSVGHVDLDELGSRVPPRGSSQRGSECGLCWVGGLGSWRVRRRVSARVHESRCAATLVLRCGVSIGLMVEAAALRSLVAVNRFPWLRGARVVRGAGVAPLAGGAFHRAGRGFLVCRPGGAAWRLGCSFCWWSVPDPFLDLREAPAFRAASRPAELDRLGEVL